jgi:hypothetical protein
MNTLLLSTSQENGAHGIEYPTKLLLLPYLSSVSRMPQCYWIIHCNTTITSTIMKMPTWTFRLRLSSICTLQF